MIEKQIEDWMRKYDSGELIMPLEDKTILRLSIDSENCVIKVTDSRDLIRISKEIDMDKYIFSSDKVITEAKVLIQYFRENYKQLVKEKQTQLKVRIIEDRQTLARLSEEW